MPIYRLYSVDDGGHIVNRHEADCDDDLAAFKKAYEFTRDHAIEVWLFERKAGTVSKGATLPPATADHR
jgi:hypothetical protein